MNGAERISTEEALRALRDRPGGEAVIAGCYYDEPAEAARRYGASEEFKEILRLMEGGPGMSVLDLGAGNGMAGVAFALNGYRAAAIEPDPSDWIGAGAIRASMQAHGVEVDIRTDWGEALPFPDGSFDRVFVRQALHHAHDLPQMLSEIGRVLKPGGLALACREHVVDDRDGSLKAFLDAHPIHAMTEGENAYTLAAYRAAFAGAGLSMRETLGPYDSIINGYPDFKTRADMERHAAAKLRKVVPVAGALLAACGPARRAALRAMSRRSRLPGRLYTFLARKRA